MNNHESLAKWNYKSDGSKERKHFCTELQQLNGPYKNHNLES